VPGTHLRFFAFGDAACKKELGPLWRGHPAREKTTDDEISKNVVFAAGSRDTDGLSFDVGPDFLSKPANRHEVNPPPRPL
jgi:hypothetical protein